MVSKGKFEKDLDLYENRINLLVTETLQKTVQTKANRLKDQLIKVHNQFFTLMADTIVGAEKAPKLQGYTPTWKQLDPEYTSRRELEADIPEEEFFRFTGTLETKLASLKPTTYLGKPSITVKQSLTQSKSKKLKDHRSKFIISVDLFPKINGTISDLDEAEVFDHVASSWVSTGGRSKKNPKIPLSYKLKSYQGQGDRPFLTYYMEWWLNVKTKNLMRRVFK